MCVYAMGGGGGIQEDRINDCLIKFPLFYYFSTKVYVSAR